MREAPMMAPPSRITRSGAGGGYPPGIRIAPSQDDFVLTRTIRNPTASSAYGGGGGGMRSDYIGRSPPQGVARVAPSIQYASHSSYNRRLVAFRGQVGLNFIIYIWFNCKYTVHFVSSRWTWMTTCMMRHPLLQGDKNIQ